MLFKKSWYRFVIIAVICFVVYIPVLFYNVTGCDDMVLIKDAAGLMNNEGGILEAFKKPYIFNEGLFYRPLVTMSFIPDLYINNSPLVFHLSNIIYLIIISCLFYVLLMRLHIKREIALMMILIFSVHPVFTNSVAWIPGRNDTLLVIFVLAGFISMLKYIETYKINFLLLNLLFFSLSLLTKESAIALPIMGLIYLFLIKNKYEKIISKTALVLLWVFIILIWFRLRNNIVTGSATFSIFKNAGFIIQGLGKILLPFNLNVLPTISDTSFLYGIIAMLILIFTFIIYFKSNNIQKSIHRGIHNSSFNNVTPLFGLIWFLIFLIPSILNVNPEYSSDLMLECRLILPMAGIFIFIAKIIPEEKATEFYNKKLYYLTIIILIFSGLTLYYSSFYKNDITFWQRAVEKSPGLDLSYSGLGLVYLHEENFILAETNYRKAVELNSFKID